MSQANLSLQWYSFPGACDAEVAGAISIIFPFLVAIEQRHQPQPCERVASIGPCCKAGGHVTFTITRQRVCRLSRGHFSRPPPFPTPHRRDRRVGLAPKKAPPPSGQGRESTLGQRGAQCKGPTT